MGEALPLLLPTFIKGDKVGRKALSRRLRRKHCSLREQTAAENLGPVLMRKYRFGHLFHTKCMLYC